MTSSFGPKGTGTFHTTGEFGFDISTLAIRTPIETDVNSDEFTDMEYLTEGSNSHIFSAKWRGQIVIVKVKLVCKHDEVIWLSLFVSYLFIVFRTFLCPTDVTSRKSSKYRGIKRIRN